MKKLLFLIVTLLCILSCSEDAQIPEVTPPVEIPTPGDEPKPVADDSIYYATEMDGFELVAASKNGNSLFLQTDTLFAFKCLFDTCQSLNLVAYCDSTGMVERIVAEERVFNFLYHEDESKVDVLYQKEGKVEWLRNMENPYAQLSSRAEEGNVPYSAISVQNRLSYAVYTIIDTYPLDINKKLSRLVKGFSIPALSVKLATEQIATILGKSFDKTYIDNHYGTIVTVMNDYARCVMDELYGNAFPDTHTWVERVGNDSVRVNCHIIGEDSTKVDYRIGLLIESGNNIVNTLFTAKKAGIMRFTCKSLPLGRKYKVRAFLAPLASSKYLSDMKCFHDYRRFGYSDTFYLFEVKSNVISQGVDEATIKLTTEVDDYHKNFKMGVCYSTNPDLLNSDYMVKDIEVESLKSNHDGTISKEIVLENLKSDTTYYYMPYIQYDGNIVNRHLSNMLDAVYEEDKIFYGEKGTFKTTDDSSIREVLTRIYNECNGVNWSYQKNWCTDLPVTEWQGIRRDNNGIYHFDFMSLNELTGTFTIENCSEKIALYSCDNQYPDNWMLEGLCLRNCSNIIYGYEFFSEDNINKEEYYTRLDLAPGLKTLLLDNVTFVVDRKNLLRVCSFQIGGEPTCALESIIIKNVKFDVNFENDNESFVSVDVYIIPHLKEIVYEGMKDNIYLNVFEIPSLDEIRLLNDSGFCNIKNCSVTDCFIENNNDKMQDEHIHLFTRNAQIKNLIIKGQNTSAIDEGVELGFDNSQIDNLIINEQNTSILGKIYIDGIPSTINNLSCVGKDYINCSNLHFYEASNINIETINLTNTSLTLSDNYQNDYNDVFMFPGSKMLKNLTMKNSHIVNHVNFDNCTNLNNVRFESVSSRDLSFNGCSKLDNFYFEESDYGYSYVNGIIDVRNTPNLKELYLECDGVKDILFDSHMNDVNIDCRYTDILKVIPDFYTGEGSGSFRYIQRYEYVYKRLPDGGYEYEKTIDHGRGWWYPGEPASKSHSRQE